MTRCLLTGAGGFIGHHTLEYMLEKTDWDVVATDSFRHKGKTDRIAALLEAHPEWRSRLSVYAHDLCAPFSDQLIQRMGQVDYVIGMASESHVPRSIDDPVTFVQNNVNVGLFTLEYCRVVKPTKILWISSDEVYGPQPPSGPHKEWAPILSSSPYSASKAAQEALSIAYWRTYGLPVVIVNCANVIGERQDPEKFIPMLVRNILIGDMVKIHGDRATGVVGSRCYLHARNFADALLYIFKLPTAKFSVALDAPDRPDRFNVIGPDSMSNLDLARRVAKIVGQPLYHHLVDFERPGHDPHYGTDGSKLAASGWKPPIPLDESLERIVTWYLDNRGWLV